MQNDTFCFRTDYILYNMPTTNIALFVLRQSNVALRAAVCRSPRRSTLSSAGPRFSPLTLKDCCENTAGLLGL